MSEPTRKAYCPHCGHPTVQRLRLELETHESLWSDAAHEEDNVGMIDCCHYIAVCTTCNGAVVYDWHWLRDKTEEPDFWTAKLAWPSVFDLPFATPDSVNRTYQSAVRIKQQAPDAFATQIRKTLEAICKEQGIKEGRLAARLDELVQRVDLPLSLAQMSDVLRHLGNVGAHEDPRNITRSQAEVIDSFCRAIIEYIYGARVALARFRTELDKEREKREQVN